MARRTARSARAAVLAVVVLCLATIGNGLAAPTAPGNLDVNMDMDMIGNDRAAATARSAYFPETGFWVSDPFLGFWEQNGGLITFGYPISRVFYQDGLLKQYFERAIFERHDEFAGTPYQVLLTRIGALTTLQRTGEQPFLRLSGATRETCQYFPETGHQLCDRFRSYWEERGGLPSFGYPLSEPFEEISKTDGKPHLVQYFERARLELHPDKPRPFDVLLGLLARESLATRPVPALAVTAEPASGPPADPLGPQPLYANHRVDCGFNFVWWGDLDNLGSNRYFLDLARDSGCTWIRVQAQWSEIEYRPGLYATYSMNVFVEEAKARGLKLLVTVDRAPAWAHVAHSGRPAEPEPFGRFMGFMASEFRGRVDAWQIWNEPNLAYEAGGLIDERGYFEMLKAAAPLIRAADPNARIVLAGMAPNSLRDRTLAFDDIDYLQILFGLDGGAVRDYFDILGAHSYGAGNSPDHFWPSNLATTPGWNNAPEFYFRHAEEIHGVLVDAGLSDRPIWLTEFGWTTKNAWADYGYGDWISPEDQARYLTRAFEIARTEWPWMDKMFIFSLNSAIFQGEGGPYVGFSLTDRYGQPRPSYQAIRAMPK